MNLGTTIPPAPDSCESKGQAQTSGRFVMSKATTCGNAIEPCADRTEP